MFRFQNGRVEGAEQESPGGRPGSAWVSAVTGFAGQDVSTRPTAVLNRGPDSPLGSNSSPQMRTYPILE
jgi:hypothetical protein